jgi:transglutaminase-like putative cysteine protease
LVTTTKPNAFLQRARLEAERYGTDPWVFVRELLQNARDAGAHRVWFETSREDGRERICCRDDGTGMTFDHAQRYLFSLYASSKRGRSRTAGQFGIGFWSVLRFEPDEIVVRSRPQRGEAWSVRLDGRLEIVTREPTTIGQGTEIVLERPTSGDNLEQRLRTAILRDAPFLNCRHRSERPLDVRTNGHLVRAEPVLPAPSMSFRRRGLHGVVGLGPEPRAEIFAHGLRVRDAATLDELLVEGRPRRPALTGARDGLAPRVIIDSRELEVLMARGDAREDHALRRLVAVGHRELSRLVRGELDRHARLSGVARLMARVGEWRSASRFAKATAAVVVAVALAFLAWGVLSPWLPTRVSEPMTAVTAPPLESPLSAPYRDLRDRYRGPDVDSVAGPDPAVDLIYRPSNRAHFFAAIWVTGLTADGRLDADQHDMITSYEGAFCGDGCLEVEIGIDAPPGLLRIPIATGHVLDPDSVHIDDEPLSVVAVATGQPAVRFDRHRTGRLRYRTGPGKSIGSTGEGVWPPLPQNFADFSRRLEGLPPSSRALATAEFVKRHITYDTSPETAAMHRQARDRSIALFVRADAIGAGDCDVQNSLVAAMLDDGGVASRLAVGWVGSEGRARSGLHAWAEYRGADGRWRAVDASADGVVAQPSTGTVSSIELVSEPPRALVPAWTRVAVLLTLVLAALTVFLSGRRWRRRFRAGDTEDVVGLLRGAAVRPRAFEEIHSLFTRRLLGLVSGRPISLARARGLARVDRLACGSQRSRLARLAARGGGVVLDLERAEGAAVADALAAVNLDRWQELLDRAVGDELTARVEDRLRAAGERCRIAIADRVASEVAMLDGAVFGLGADARWVVVDARSRLWESVRRLSGHWPSRAALLLADSVVHRTGAPAVVLHQCLATLAMDALIEAAEAAS